MNNELVKVKKFNEKYIIILIIIIGCLFRIIAIDKLPIGLNCDEASSAYDAYSILNYGMDRNGNKFPVFLKAWGSGQNALYSYIMIPFIKILGVNLYSTRLPMAIIGCISLIIWYLLIKEITNRRKYACIGLTFLIICPWHIMKSRWGLESNIFPDLVLWAVFLIIKFWKTDQIKWLYLSSVLLGLSLYSYGTSYLFIPIFCFGLYLYFLRSKKVPIVKCIYNFLIIFIIAIPIMLYVIINTFGLEQINLPFMTIPKMVVNRYEEQTNLDLLLNIKNSIKLIFLQDDNLAWNNISGYGMYYLVSIPFLIIGCIFSFKNSKFKYDFDVVMNIWFLSALILLFVLGEANINRINILIFPLIYYIVKGIIICWERKNIYLNIGLIIIYSFNFILFANSYINMDSKDYWTFATDIEEVIKYVDNLEVDDVYFEYSFKEPFIYVLYYTQADTQNFIETVKYFIPNGTFENIAGFGKYHFDNQIILDENKSNVYVICKGNLGNIDTEKWDVKDFGKYEVVKLK